MNFRTYGRVLDSLLSVDFYRLTKDKVDSIVSVIYDFMNRSYQGYPIKLSGKSCLFLLYILLDKKGKTAEEEGILSNLTIIIASQNPTYDISKFELSDYRHLIHLDY